MNHNSVAVAMLIVSGVLVTACAAGPSDELSLLDTKSTIQLLRNETAGRVPSDILESAVNSEDTSKECDGGDPYRHWWSSVILIISAERASEAPDIFAELVASYADDGWEVDTAGLREAVLSNEASIAKIDILMTEDGDGDGEGASVEVAVTGPCVMTDGEGSDEVTRLEEMSR